MKKILFILISLVFLTGCSNTFTYEFKENTISSTIELEFNDNEYTNYQKTFGIEYNKETTPNMHKLIDDTYKSASAIAYKDENGKYFYYNPINYERNSNNNKYTYSYDFNYETIKSNYYLNDCFDYFTATEDDKYYYYHINGAYTCGNENNLTFNIKANNRLADSNAVNRNKDVHSWDIRKNENDIYFIISKNELNNSKISKITTISFIIIALLAIGATILYKKVQKEF